MNLLARFGMTEKWNPAQVVIPGSGECDVNSVSSETGTKVATPGAVNS